MGEERIEGFQDVLEDGGIERVEDELSPALGDHEIGTLEGVEVVAQGRSREGEVLLDLGYGEVPLPEKREDLASMWVREGFED